MFDFKELAKTMRETGASRLVIDRPRRGKRAWYAHLEGGVDVEQVGYGGSGGSIEEALYDLRDRNR
jgi:hypothetical protein